MALFLYLGIAVALATPCPSIFPKLLLSECDLNGFRIAAYYWENCTEPLPAPVFDLACDLNCQAGYFLGLSEATKQSSCQECPENTYSEGGALYYFPGKWNDYEDTFNSHCYLNYGKRISVKGTCPSWDVEEERQVLSTGEGVDEVWYESVLEGNFHLMKRGKVHIKYRYFGAYWGNKQTAVFALTIKGRAEIIREVDEKQVAQWTEIVKVLEPGDYNLEISYKFLFISEANTGAEIEFLTITGTQMSDLSCIPCAPGTYSHRASPSCYQCPINNYYDPSAKSCSGCPSSMYCPAGSLGPSSCLPRAKCTERDYAGQYSPCKDNHRTQSFEWIQPQICDSLGSIQPPDEKEISCELCLPGYYHAQIGPDEQVCRACPEGSYTTIIGYSEGCEACPAGHFAAKALNYTVWSPFPPEITNECRKKTGAQCTFNTGWIPSLYSLTSGPIHESEIELVLTRYVNVIHKAATVSFAYTIQDAGQGGSLEFLIDNRITKEYKSSVVMAQSGAIPLKLGYHKLSWVYYHPGGGSDIAYLHYVAVEGTDEGGASSCLPCPAAFWSTKESTICTPCPAGFSSVPGSSECSKCSEDEFSPLPGSLCLKCLENTVSNEGRTACIAPNVLNFGSTEVPIWTLFAASKSPEFSSSAQTKLFIKDTFYGPIVSPKGRKYYISILNPAKLELVEYVSVGNLPYGYAYGLLNSKLVNFSKTFTSESEYYCLKGDEDVLVNLGSQVQALTHPEGVSIVYAGGEQCNPQGSHFTSDIQLTCNSLARDSWPQITQETDCHVSFAWETRYVCPICSHEETHMSVSSCIEGKRLVTLLEPANCILVDVDRDWWEGCNEVMDILGKWQTYVAVAALVGVLGITVLLVYCYCRVKHSYTRLREFKGRESS